MKNISKLSYILHNVVQYIHSMFYIYTQINESTYKSCFHLCIIQQSSKICNAEQIMKGLQEILKLAIRDNWTLRTGTDFFLCASSQPPTGSSQT